MKSYRLKVKDKILFSILPVIIISLSVITFLGYTLAMRILMNEYGSHKAQVETHVKNAVSLIDAGFRMLEENIEIEMEKGILEFKNEFEKAGGDPDKLSLEELKSKMGTKFDLMIIDSDTTIIKSTAPEAMNFNFMQFDRALGEEINRIRLSDAIRHERIRTNVGTGYLSKFTYIPAKDHKYLLEIAYEEKGLSSIVSELEPLKITGQLVNTNPIVSGIRIFDVYGYEFVDRGENYEPTAESINIVERAKKEKEYEVKEGNKVKRYFFIDLDEKKQTMTDNSKIVEIVYDSTILVSSLNKVAYISFTVGAAIVGVIILIIIYISRRITDPISQLSAAAKKVAAGDYDVSAQKANPDEIGELCDVFNLMIEKIKGNFEKTENQKAKLEDYNKNLEQKVEERTSELVMAKEQIKREKYLLERILDEALSGYWDWDLTNNTEYLSPGFKRMFGYDDHELENSPETWQKLIFPEDLPKVMECFKKHVESLGNIPYYNEVRYLHKDGSTVWVICVGHVVEWDADKKPLQMVGCHINITDLKRLEKSLSEERELLKATLLSMGDGVISTDVNGKVEIMNAAAEKLTGWTHEDAHGRPFEEVFNIINEDTRERCTNPIKKVLEAGAALVSDNHGVLVSKDGLGKPIEACVAPIKDENGCTSGAVLIFRDFSEKKEKQEKIEYLSFHDQLTGLYNRRFLEEKLMKLDAGNNLPLTLVIIDVNGLKLINDAFGHSMGDKVLQKAAEVMDRVCRSKDIVARFGGDEFVILLPGTDNDEVEILLQRIVDLIAKAGVGSVNISVSYGWATKANTNERIADIFKTAEDHMYRRKLTESKSMHYKTVEIILKTLHEKSEREKMHSERVSKLSESIGNVLNLNDEDIRQLRTTGLMHDIGKIAIDLSILDKASQLNSSERAQIERHPELGYQILRSINEFAKLAEYVLAHHERWDGKGYPRGIKGEEIPLEARIITLADSYDAMTSDRPYRKAMSREAAIYELKKNAGSQFDPNIVKIFIDKVLENE